MKEVDARGRSCPEPVIMTKRALKEGRAMGKHVSASEEGTGWRIAIRK